MKKVNPNTCAYFTLAFLACLIFYAMACQKIASGPQPVVIDLGKTSTSTTIKSISQTNNVVTATFVTTPGSKYSVQITPFGSDDAVKSEGFTAADSLTTKTYNLSDLAKKNYDLHFLDVAGKEVKYPITIK